MELTVKSPRFKSRLFDQKNSIFQAHFLPMLRFVNNYRFSQVTDVVPVIQYVLSMEWKDDNDEKQQLICEV